MSDSDKEKAEKQVQKDAEKNNEEVLSNDEMDAIEEQNS